MWKEHLGAEVSLRSEDFRVLKAAIDAREAPLFRGSWIGDYNDAYSFLQVLKGGFGINLPRYASDAYDVALAMAAASAGRRRRATCLAAAERQLLADVPLIPLYFYVSKHLVAPRVDGWYDNVMNVTYSKDLAVGGDAPFKGRGTSSFEASGKCPDTVRGHAARPGRAKNSIHNQHVSRDSNLARPVQHPGR